MKAEEKNDWSIPDKDGMIDVPDELMPLFNKIRMQIRFLTISGKSEIITIAHIVQICEQRVREEKVKMLEGLQSKFNGELESETHDEWYVGWNSAVSKIQNKIEEELSKLKPSVPEK